MSEFGATIEATHTGCSAPTRNSIRWLDSPAPDRSGQHGSDAALHVVVATIAKLGKDTVPNLGVRGPLSIMQQQQQQQHTVRDSDYYKLNYVDR